MHFSVNFNSSDSPDYNLGFDLCFLPSPCWMKGQIELINLNPKSPYYSDVKGGCQSLMEMEKIAPPMRVTILALPGGHGGENDLLALEDDLNGCGFEVETLRSGFNEEI